MVSDLPVGTLLRVTTSWSAGVPNGSVCEVMPDILYGRTRGFTIRFQDRRLNDQYNGNPLGFFFNSIHWQKYFERADGPW